MPWPSDKLGFSEENRVKISEHRLGAHNYLLLSNIYVMKITSAVPVPAPNTAIMCQTMLDRN